MKTLFKLITLPIWLPLAVLWFIAKLIVLVILVIIIVFIVVHFI